MSPQPGKVITRRDSGRRGVAPNGRALVFNADGYCFDRCGLNIKWTFTDDGFVDGGQNGAYRAYNDPSEVPASPWILSPDKKHIRLNFEDDWNCKQHNPYAQLATAVCMITAPTSFQISIDWDGEAEQADQGHDRMEIRYQAIIIGQAWSPGGGLDCSAPMAPVMSTVHPVTIMLERGWNYIHFEGHTVTNEYHYGAFYVWDLIFPP